MKNYDQFIKDFSALIGAKSVQTEKVDGAPFGEGVAKAYSVFKNICNKMGFDVIDYDGYIGEVYFPSDGNCEGEPFGVIGHLDVVPAEGDWNTPPFTLTLKDGVFYGRGVQDDKGPTLACLYAVKELLDEGYKFKRPLRFIIGLNEESGWQDVDYFLTKSTFPKEGFSPDGNFPVTYAEKGVYRVVVSIPYKGSATNISGGTVVNAVCDYASASVKIDDTLIKKHCLKVADDGRVESFGKSAHGAKPHLGKNAIRGLLAYISDLDGGVFDNVVKGLFDDGLGIFKIASEVGSVTISPNKIKQTDSGVELLCDLRIPAKVDVKTVLNALDNLGEKYTLISSRDPHYVEKNGALVQGLLSAYNKVTGENAEPYSCAGATFASVFKSGVAFGPEFEGEDGAIHEPNEYIKEETLLKCFAIYKEALKTILC